MIQTYYAIGVHSTPIYYLLAVKFILRNLFWSFCSSNSSVLIVFRMWKRCDKAIRKIFNVWNWCRTTCFSYTIEKTETCRPSSCCCRLRTFVILYENMYTSFSECFASCSRESLNPNVSLHGSCWALKGKGIVSLLLLSGKWRPTSASSVFSISYIVRVLKQAWDNASHRRGLLVSRFDFSLNNDYELPLEVQCYKMKIIWTVAAEIFPFWLFTCWRDGFFLMYRKQMDKCDDLIKYFKTLIRAICKSFTAQLR